jgi:hypothetical protein
MRQVLRRNAHVRKDLRTRTTFSAIVARRRARIGFVAIFMANPTIEFTVLVYDSRPYAGLGFSPTNRIVHREGNDRLLVKPAKIGRRVFIRMRNDRHIVTFQTSTDGKTWTRFESGEVSGYHHNVADGLQKVVDVDRLRLFHLFFCAFTPDPDVGE